MLNKIVGKVNDKQNKTNSDASTQHGNRSSNKFVALENLEDSTGIEINVSQKKEVDYFIYNKVQPTPIEISKWSQDMEKYFKEK